MRRQIFAAALVVALQQAAFARSAMETSQLVDDSGMPIGTPANPLFVSGGGGGGGGTVTQGAAATDTVGNRWPMLAYQGGTWSVAVNNFPAMWAITSTQLPTALGPNTAANSLTVTLATDGMFRNTAGLPNDATWDGAATSASQTAILKALTTKLLSGIVKTDGSGVTQPVSGTVTLGAGAATIGSIANTAFGISGSLPGFAATPTFNIGTTGGLALDATLTSRLGTLGQKASAGSAPVVIASDQSAIPVSGTVSALNLGVYNSTAPTITSGAQTILQATSNGSLFVDLSRGGAFTLPTGASTSANQTTEITALQAANARISVTAEATKASYAATSTNALSNRSPTGVYTRINYVAGCSQAATLIVRGSNDGQTTSWVYLASASIPAGTDTALPAAGAVPAIGSSLSVPSGFTSYQASIVMGSTAGTCTVTSSLTGN